jgi:hypothetical protein
MEGRDAVNVLHKAQDLVSCPLHLLPNGRRIGKALDGIGDAVHQILQKKPNNTPGRVEGEDSTEQTDHSGPKEAQARQRWQFAYFVGKKARQALVQQRIRLEWQVRHNRDNLAWQVRLDRALADLYNCYKGEYRFDALVQMAPLWVTVVHGERIAWRLFVDTGISEIGDDLEETPVTLDTGFELSGIDDGSA